MGIIKSGMGEFLALGLLDRYGYTEIMDVLRRAQGSGTTGANGRSVPQLLPKRKPGRSRKNPRS